jgi:hypothetical protein
VRRVLTRLIALGAALVSDTALASPQTDRQTVARLDVEFQAAVKVSTHVGIRGPSLPQLRGRLFKP